MVYQGLGDPVAERVGVVPRRRGVRAVVPVNAAVRGVADVEERAAGQDQRQRGGREVVRGDDALQLAGPPAVQDVRVGNPVEGQAGAVGGGNVDGHRGQHLRRAEQQVPV